MEKFAIFGLIEPLLSAKIREWQNQLTIITKNDLALAFPVHITLRGPFLADSSSQAVLWQTVHRVMAKFKKIPLNITLPIILPPDLCWIEIAPHSETKCELNSLHEQLEEITQELVLQDLTDPSHKFSRYRPHLTLGWGVSGKAYEKFISQNSFHYASNSYLSRISLVHYSAKWPQEDSVVCIENE